jgi:signal transduction histidine kinase
MPSTPQSLASRSLDFRGAWAARLRRFLVLGRLLEFQAVLAAGLMVSLVLAAWVSHKTRELDRERLRREAGLLAALVEYRFDLHREGLENFRMALNGTGGESDWRFFSNHVASVYPAMNYPAFIDFGLLRKVSLDARPGYGEFVRNNAHAPFDLRFPGGISNEWISFPITFHQYVHAEDARPVEWGLDVNQDIAEHSFLQYAWPAERPGVTASGPSVYGQGSNSWIRLYLGVMGEGRNQVDWASESNRLATPNRTTRFTGVELTRQIDGEIRFEHLKGVLFGTLDVERLLAASFPSDAPPLAVAIYDGKSGPDLRRMAGRLAERPYLATERVERYWGRDWLFRFTSTPAWESSSLIYWKWVTLGVGSGLTAVLALAAGLWAEGRERDREARREAEFQRAEVERARDAMRVAEEERQRLRRNLHDAVLQRIYVAALHARRTANDLRRLVVPRLEDVEAQASELDAAMKEIRDFLTGTRDSGLTGEALASALRGVAVAYRRQTRMEVVLDLLPSVLDGVASEHGTHLLQVLREGLSNACRHGKARRCLVRLVGKEDGLGMEIEDDGQGFDMTRTSEGQGLANLRARTRECGGEFSIDSRPGGPTILAAWIPHRPTSA